MQARLIFLFRVVNITGLIEHMNSNHNTNITILEKYFSTSSEFLTWKSEEEEVNNSSFVWQCAPQLSSTRNEKKYYYYCNRSGHYKAKGTGARQLIVQGSCQVETACTAHLKVTKYLKTKLSM